MESINNMTRAEVRAMARFILCVYDRRVNAPYTDDLLYDMGCESLEQLHDRLIDIRSSNVDGVISQ